MKRESHIECDNCGYDIEGCERWAGCLWGEKRSVVLPALVSPCDGCDVEVEGDTWYHAKKCPVAKLLRDAWCSPQWFTDLLPTVDIDPCSNERSTVKARRHVRLPENGLGVSWKDLSVYFNGPFSDLLPWFVKAKEASSFIAMVNLDPSTRWWKTGVQNGGRYIFTFDKRIPFSPPPHIRQSTNSKPQALICNWSGALMLDDRLNHLGQWWSAEGVLSVPTDLDTRVDCG